MIYVAKAVQMYQIIAYYIV